MRSYEAARTYFSVLGFLSWCVIILGGLVALVAIAAFGEMSRGLGGSPMAGLAGIAPGLGISFAGFLGLVFVQIGRAGVDTAEYTQQMLKIARDQLEVSKQALRTSNSQPNTFGALRAEQDAGHSDRNERRVVTAAPVKHAPDEVIEYRDRSIVRSGMAFSVSGQEYVSLERAKRAVDLELKERPNFEPQNASTTALTGGASDQKDFGPQQIEEIDGKFVFGNMSFGSREAADRYVQQLGVTPNFKS